MQQQQNVLEPAVEAGDLLKEGRNRQFDFMMAVGIIFVVLGHSYEPKFLFYPAFSFHMPLFFFISGYFFKPQNSLIGKLEALHKKTKSQLLPYIALNILFGLITMAMNARGFKLGADIDFDSLVVKPLLRGDQFLLFIPAWFLINLYIINLLAIILFDGKRLLTVVKFILLGAALFPLLKMQVGIWEDSWRVTGIRIVIGLFFFISGYVFKMFELKIKKYILSPITIVILYLIINVLNENFGKITYNILFANIVNKLVFIPVITTFCIIFIIYIIAYHVSKILKENSIAYLIGQNTFSIMVWHLTGFFIVNYCLYLLNFISYSDIYDDVYYAFNKTKLWIIYTAAGIILPILISKGYRFAKKKVLLSIPGMTPKKAQAEA